MKLYRSCHQLPLDRFADCLCDENYSSLVIEGEANLEQLQDAWFDIYKEFTDLSHSPDLANQIKLEREIGALKCKLLKVENCLKTIAIVHDNLAAAEDQLLPYYNDAVAILRKMNFLYKYDLKNYNFLVRDIKVTQTRSKAWAVELAIAESELQAHLAKQTGEKVDRIYFTQSLVRMSKYYGYRLDPRDITVAEYCQLKNDYFIYVEQVRRKNNA